MTNTLPGSSRVPLRAGTYALLAAGFLAFAVYGSWVPFHYRPFPFSEARAQFALVCSRPVSVDSISDWVANVLLFVPIGFAHGFVTLEDDVLVMYKTSDYYARSREGGIRHQISLVICCYATYARTPGQGEMKYETDWIEE